MTTGEKARIICLIKTLKENAKHLSSLINKHGLEKTQNEIEKFYRNVEYKLDEIWYTLSEQDKKEILQRNI